MARTYHFVVGPKDAHLRLDRYLVRHLPQTLSRTAIQRVIREDQVTIEGTVAKAHQRLKAGQTITARFDQLPQSGQDALIAPEPIPLEIVYEDEELLVVNKPPGLVTHPAPGHWSGTLVNAIVWHLQQRQKTEDRGQKTEDQEFVGLTSQVSRPLSHLPRAGIVHRLDKDTSGLLLVAKTAHALRALAKQLKARTLARHYLALVEGHVEYNEGTINASIGRHLTHRKVMTVRYLGGRQAVTHYRVLKRLGVEGSRFKVQGNLEPRTLNLERFRYTVLEVRLETGRTHQVRVHLAHVGHPVLGDPVYSRHPASYWNALGIARQLLHAYAIRFLHPTAHKPVELTAGIPDDMARWIPEEAALSAAK